VENTRETDQAVETVTSQAGLQIRSIVDEAGENRFILTGILDAYLAENLHRCALDLLESGLDIAVDLSDVDSMDVCSMQILLALRGDIVSLGRRFVVSAASENAVRFFRMAGIAGIFAVA
jgi:anti-anti-sigma factor